MRLDGTGLGMRVGAIVAVVVGGLPGVAAAHPVAPLEDLGPLSRLVQHTDNIEHLGWFPEHTGTAGGRLVGDTFFLTDPRGVYAYDVSDPTSPSLLGQWGLHPVTDVSTQRAFMEEDPDTDGRILLVDGVPTEGVPTLLRDHLQVVDVSDPTRMTLLASLDVAAHTWTCVSATDDGLCDYGYGSGSTGTHIVDLTDPSRPVVAGDWAESIGTDGVAAYAHDLTQIRPGLVFAAGLQSYLLDTTDPAQPVALTSVAADLDNFVQYHQVEWGRSGRDPVLVLGTETASAVEAPGGISLHAAGSDCSGEPAVVEFWDASQVVAALAEYSTTGLPAAFDGRSFREPVRYQASGRGLFTDGQAPANAVWCAHWFELHPDFDGGGRVAIGYFERGLRFVRVGADRTPTEEAWIASPDAYTSSAQWVGSDEEGDIVYMMDYRRGLEILRVREEAATGVVTSAVDFSPTSTLVHHQGAPPVPVNTPALTVGLIALAAGRLRRGLPVRPGLTPVPA